MDWTKSPNSSPTSVPTNPPERGMARAFWAVCLWLASAAPGWALDFNSYHSQEDIDAYMREAARQHPDLVHFHFLGYSQRGREIDYVVLAKGDPETLPAIYL